MAPWQRDWLLRQHLRYAGRQPEPSQAGAVLPAHLPAHLLADFLHRLEFFEQLPIWAGVGRKYLGFRHPEDCAVLCGPRLYSVTSWFGLKSMLSPEGAVEAITVTAGPASVRMDPGSFLIKTPDLRLALALAGRLGMQPPRRRGRHGYALQLRCPDAVAFDGVVEQLSMGYGKAMVRDSDTVPACRPAGRLPADLDTVLADYPADCWL